MRKLVLVVLTALLCFAAGWAADKKTAVKKNKAEPQTAIAPAEQTSGASTNLQKLEDTDPAVRRNALIYLGAERKKENFGVLSKMLADPEAEVRRAAVNALAISGDSRAASTLIEKFKAEDNVNVRVNIVSALGEMKSKGAIEMMKKLLKDPYPAFRNEAVRALGKINSPETYPRIAAMLRDESEGVRVMAAETVARLKIAAAVPDLQKNLENPVGVVRRSAADALGAVGDISVKESLEKMLKDTDQSVVKAAESALEKIKARSGTAGKPSVQPEKTERKGK